MRATWFGSARSAASRHSLRAFWSRCRSASSASLTTADTDGALPASTRRSAYAARCGSSVTEAGKAPRSEEHTSELPSLAYLVCRLLLVKKKDTNAKLFDISTQLILPFSVTHQHLFNLRYIDPLSIRQSCVGTLTQTDAQGAMTA